MKLRRRAVAMTPAAYSTIDTIDADATPSLAGFWKCNESSGQVLDYSQYGEHLTQFTQGSANNQVENLTQMFTHQPGWVSMAYGTGAGVTLSAENPILDPAKHVVWSAEVANWNPDGGFYGLTDMDTGTAWDIVDPANDPYQGFMLGGNNNLWYSRFIGLDAGATRVESSNSQGAEFAQRKSATIASGMVLGSRHVTSKKQSNLAARAQETETTVAATIMASTTQDGIFAVYGGSSAAFVSIRNYQVWAFDSEPPMLEATLEWMVHNSGCIPPWWVGL